MVRKFDLLDGSYEIQNIEDCFLKMIQKNETTIKTDEESPILIYPDGVRNRLNFRIEK